MKIALLCPTRERPKDVNRLIKSLENTTNFDNVTLYLGVDDDDPTKKQIENFEKKYKFVTIIPIPASPDGSFLGLGKIWNIMASQVDEDIFSMIGDDMIFETKDWDNMILDEFKKVNDKVLLISGNDGMRGAGNPFPNHKPLAVNSFIHRLYYETFGYYTIENFKHGYHDTWLQDVFDLTGRTVYRHDIMINHLHVSNPNSGAVVDEVTNRLNQSYGEVSDPDRTYRNLLPVRKAEAAKLKEIIAAKANDKKLSILICTMFNRDAFFQRLLVKLREQENSDINIHYEIDDGTMTIGEKRNKLLKKAEGEYIAFIDDDDMVSDNYVDSILNAIDKSNPDVIGMHLLMTVDGQNEERTYHSLKYDHWYDEPDPDPDREGLRRYFRNPNHLNPVKREHALKAGFPNINEAEDREYSKNLLQYLKTEEYIEDPIYFYEYRSVK